MPSFVRRKGLEPPRLSTLDPKSSAATNYANAASLGLRLQSYDFYLDCARVFTFFFTKLLFLSMEIILHNLYYIYFAKKFFPY